MRRIKMAAYRSRTKPMRCCYDQSGFKREVYKAFFYKLDILKSSGSFLGKRSITSVPAIPVTFLINPVPSNNGFCWDGRYKAYLSFG